MAALPLSGVLCPICGSHVASRASFAAHAASQPCRDAAEEPRTTPEGPPAKRGRLETICVDSESLGTQTEPEKPQGSPELPSKAGRVLGDSERILSLDIVARKVFAILSGTRELGKTQLLSARLSGAFALRTRLRRLHLDLSRTPGSAGAAFFCSRVLPRLALRRLSVTASDRYVGPILQGLRAGSRQLHSLNLLLVGAGAKWPRDAFYPFPSLRELSFRQPGRPDLLQLAPAGLRTLRLLGQSSDYVVTLRKLVPFKELRRLTLPDDSWQQILPSSTAQTLLRQLSRVSFTRQVHRLSPRDDLRLRHFGSLRALRTNGDLPALPVSPRAATGTHNLRRLSLFDCHELHRLLPLLVNVASLRSLSLGGTTSDTTNQRGLSQVMLESSWANLEELPLTALHVELSFVLDLEMMERLPIQAPRGLRRLSIDFGFPFSLDEHPELCFGGFSTEALPCLTHLSVRKASGAFPVLGLYPALTVLHWAWEMEHENLEQLRGSLRLATKADVAAFDYSAYWRGVMEAVRAAEEEALAAERAAWLGLQHRFL